MSVLKRHTTLVIRSDRPTRRSDLTNFLIKSVALTEGGRTLQQIRDSFTAGLLEKVDSARLVAVDRKWATQSTSEGVDCYTSNKILKEHYSRVYQIVRTHVLTGNRGQWLNIGAIYDRVDNEYFSKTQVHPAWRYPLVTFALASLVSENTIEESYSANGGAGGKPLHKFKPRQGEERSFELFFSLREERPTEDRDITVFLMKLLVCSSTPYTAPEINRAFTHNLELTAEQLVGQLVSSNVFMQCQGGVYVFSEPITRLYSFLVAEIESALGNTPTGIEVEKFAPHLLARLKERVGTTSPLAPWVGILEERIGLLVYAGLASLELQQKAQLISARGPKGYQVFAYSAERISDPLGMLEGAQL